MYTIARPSSHMTGSRARPLLFIRRGVNRGRSIGAVAKQERGGRWKGGGTGGLEGPLIKWLIES